LDSNINNEMGIHGEPWDRIHNGYFGDPAVAACLLGPVTEAMTASSPEVIVDLGGGTGYILDELSKGGLDPAIDLIDIDISNQQLDQNKSSRITTIRASLDEFERSHIDRQEKRFLFIMRSVLHYFGQEHLEKILQHLRSQMKRGEFFVHQTACFDQESDAACLNRLYDNMRTGKYYPTVDKLSDLLVKSGWSIQFICPASPLELSSSELAGRYRFAEKEIVQFCHEMRERFKPTDDVLKTTPNGYCAYLHYKTYTCLAE